jgi:KaiC/GvpD/RAD55 family RecA-like ATPase
MDNEIDEALFNFRKIRLIEKSLYTEADTRAKIIDQIFQKCLGWSESDFSREDRVEGGFIDYVLSIDGIPRIVIEAKKNGDYFELPLDMKIRKYKINAAISKVENVLKYIEQAQRYCVEKGIKYGIVTNGNQLIIFQAFVDMKEWRNEDCLVYNSFKEIDDHFPEFWNTLSKKAIRLNWLAKQLVGDPRSILFCRPLDQIHNNDETLVRNHLAGVMVPLSKYIFEEMIDDSKIDVLRNCYVYNKAYEKAGAQFQTEFSNQELPEAKLHRIEDFIESKDAAGKFQINFQKCAEFLRKDQPEGTVSVLLGGIGSGKTTFLHRFFKIVLVPDEKVLWFYVDFRKGPTEAGEIKSFLITKIVEYYDKTYSERLKEKLVALDVYRSQTSIEYLTKLFTVLKILGFTLSIVVDNVDQHYQLYPEMQEKVFLEAQSITDALKTITILSLREESFFRHGFSGAYGAYFVSLNRVSPPHFNLLLQKRIEYLLNLLKLPEEEIGLRLKTKRPLLKKEIEDLKTFFEIVRESFKPEMEKPKYIMKFIENIAGSNMRKGLEMFNLFLISGNTKVSEMLTYYRSKGFYTIAYHHVLKSIILGEFRYYSSTRSHVMNIFDLNPENNSSHFLRLKILRYAKERLSFDSGAERGYVSIEKLKQEGEKILIGKEAIEEALTKLAQFGLVNFNNNDPSAIKTASYFKVTPTGLYYLEELCGRFVYLDLVWVDTPIADESLEKQLRYSIGETDMKIRFDRTSKFVDYLCKMEKTDFLDNPFYFGSPLGKYKFTDHIARGFEDDQKHIMERLHYRESY